MAKFPHRSKTYLRSALAAGMALLLAGCVVAPAEPLPPPPAYGYYYPNAYYAYPPYGPPRYYYGGPAVGVGVHIR